MQNKQKKQVQTIIFFVVIDRKFYKKSIPRKRWQLHSLMTGERNEVDFKISKVFPSDWEKKVFHSSETW